jgi:hypothetical protein
MPRLALIVCADVLAGCAKSVRQALERRTVERELKWEATRPPHST